MSTCRTYNLRIQVCQLQSRPGRDDKSIHGSSVCISITKNLACSCDCYRRKPIYTHILPMKAYEYSIITVWVPYLPLGVPFVLTTLQELSRTHC